MNWIKKHKLWSLVFLYFGTGFAISILGGLLGALNPLAVGQLVGIFFWVYLFACFISLRIVERRRG